RRTPAGAIPQAAVDVLVRCTIGSPKAVAILFRFRAPVVGRRHVRLRFTYHRHRGLTPDKRYILAMHGRTRRSSDLRHTDILLPTPNRITIMATTTATSSSSALSAVEIIHHPLRRQRSSRELRLARSEPAIPFPKFRI